MYMMSSIELQYWDQLAKPKLSHSRAGSRLSHTALALDLPRESWEQGSRVVFT